MRSIYMTHLCISVVRAVVHIWAKNIPPSFLGFRRLDTVLCTAGTDYRSAMCSSI